MTISIFYLFFGVLMLFYGAEWIVRGGSHFAARMGLSPVLIGLTIVAFGTSMPELVVSLIAALKGNQDIAVGNVVGSNIANVGLVLGLSSVLYPIFIDYKMIRKDLLINVFCSLFFILFYFDGLMNRWEGLSLFSGIILYSWFSVTHPHHQVEKITEGKDTVSRCFYYMLSGVLLLYFGSKLFVEGAVSMAKILGISEIIIGMTIVAVGTSLPELVTSLVAAYRKEHGISLGNIVGSNIFNILSVIGLVSFIKPMTLPKGMMKLEIPVMLIFSLILFPITRIKQPIPRWISAALLLVYSVFIVLMFNKT